MQIHIYELQKYAIIRKNTWWDRMKNMKKREQYQNIIRFGFCFVLLAALTVSWGYVWFGYYSNLIPIPFYFRGNLVVIAVYGFLQLFFSSFYGGYKIGFNKRGDVIYSGILALIFCNILTYVQTSLLVAWFASVYPLIFLTLIQAVFIIFWAIITDGLMLGIFPVQKMLMIYGGNALADNLQQKILSYPKKYAIEHTININEGLNNALKEARNFEAVILCDIASNLRNDLIKFCFKHGIKTYTTPKIPDILLRGASEINLFDTPLLLNDNKGITLEQRFLKRVIDILLSFIGIILTLPFMFFIYIIVKLYDRGPSLYKQTRLTYGGREFVLYKFRSMIPNAEKKSGAMLAMQSDKRITPIGKILRMLRLDELPQLFNILKGDMSLVGPRPERPEIVKRYQQDIPEFEYRLKVKAGLTGLAQIKGRYNTTAYDKLKLDLTYITNFSLLQDIKIMLATVKILFVKESSQGVE